MAKSETDIAMLYAHAISDRIEEYERENLEMPKISAIKMLKGMMDIKGLKQSNLNHIATQSVIREILSGKRIINIKQAKGFFEHKACAISPIYGRVKQEVTSLFSDLKRVMF